MIAAATPAVPTQTAVHGPAFIVRLQRSSMWLTGFSGAFTLVEPAPYEVVTLGAFVLFATTGLAIRAAHLPLIFLLILINLGFAIGVLPVLGLPNTLMWTAVSCYMALTTLLFALALGADTEARLARLMNGYVAGALVAATVAILAYFRLIPGADVFLWAGRAQGTLKHPNIFGPFLVLPALIVMQRLISGNVRALMVSGAQLAVLAGALLFSFSRGAWMHFAVSAILMIGVSFVASRSHRERLRIVLFSASAVALLGLVLAALLSMESVAALFQQRSSLLNTYDAGHTGRFGRHILGALMIFDHPIGIGPMQFSKYLPEDPHNSFLDSFMTGGWLGGFAWLTLMLATLAMGFRHLFAATPWQPTYIAAYATFVGEIGESYVIDVQHWRHYFLILGVIWGLMALQAQGARGRPDDEPAPAARPT